MAALAGLIVARWTLAGIGAMLPAEAVQTIDVVAPAGRAGLFRACWRSVLVCCLGFSRRSTARDRISFHAQKSGRTAVGRARRGAFRTSLATVQIALSMVLLVSAGLFIKSLVNVSKVDLGLKLDNVITFAVSPELNGYKRSDRSRFSSGSRMSWRRSRA